MDEEPPVLQVEQSQADKWYTPLTRDTPLSKYLALALFIVLPFVGFWFGYRDNNDNDINRCHRLSDNEGSRHKGSSGTQRVVYVPNDRSCIYESFNSFEAPNGTYHAGGEMIELFSKTNLIQFTYDGSPRASDYKECLRYTLLRERYFNEGVTYCPGFLLGNSVVGLTEWSTYHDDRFGFEFMYPKEWHLIQNAPENALYKIVFQHDNSTSTITLVLSGKPESQVGLVTCPYDIHETECEVVNNHYGLSFVRSVVDAPNQERTTTTYYTVVNDDMPLIVTAQPAESKTESQVITHALDMVVATLSPESQ